MDYSKLRTSLILFGGILACGTFGYAIVDHMPLYDAFYMTIITISTVGFSEIRPLSPGGRAITIFIIVTGIGLGTYTLGLFVRLLVEGELQYYLGRRKLRKNIADLKDHYIICGFGRIGRIVCEELMHAGIPFVVIEHDACKIEALEENKYLYLIMDATTEEALRRAGITTAKGLVTAVRSDANNVFITLTAKGLRPDIFVLSRTSDIANEDKLLRAGATRVIAPYQIGGRRMAQVLKSPTVIDFIDTALMNTSLDLAIEEALISPDSDYAGMTLIESNIRRDFGIIMIAIKKADGRMVFNPLPSEKLGGGDVAVVIGKREELERLRHELE
ncbi:MAG: potassium channel protein [Desulfobacterales bacterium]|jgi:voltage-gated potassium channel